MSQSTSNSTNCGICGKEMIGKVSIAVNSRYHADCWIHQHEGNRERNYEIENLIDDYPRRKKYG